MDKINKQNQNNLKGNEIPGDYETVSLFNSTAKLNLDLSGILFVNAILQYKEGLKHFTKLEKEFSKYKKEYIDKAKRYDHDSKKIYQLSIK